MKRIRTLSFLAALLFAMPAAHAAMTDVKPEGNWKLRTATSSQMTKDFFCASEGKFERDFGMTIARNLLGQNSLILTWPGFSGTTGTAVPLRLSADEKGARDVQAIIKAPGVLVAALGWDDDTIRQLAGASRVVVASANMNVRYNMRGSGQAVSRLNSCAASLAARLPSSKGLSSEVRDTLNKAKLNAKMIQVTTENDNNSAENFLVDGIFGGSAILNSKTTDVTQRMLDYVDQLELLCRARFSSELGAPTPTRSGEITGAEARCDTMHAGTLTALTFVNEGDEIRVYYFEGDKARATQVRNLRDMVQAALQNK